MPYVTITSTRYHTCYRTIFLSLACLRGYLQLVITRYSQMFQIYIYIYIYIYIDIFLKK